MSLSSINYLLMHVRLIKFLSIYFYPAFICYLI